MHLNTQSCQDWGWDMHLLLCDILHSITCLFPLFAAIRTWKVINRWCKMWSHLNYMATSAEWNLKSCVYVFMPSNNLVGYSPGAFGSKEKCSPLRNRLRDGNPPCICLMKSCLIFFQLTYSIWFISQALLSSVFDVGNLSIKKEVIPVLMNHKT